MTARLLHPTHRPLVGNDALIGGLGLDAERIGRAQRWDAQSRPRKREAWGRPVRAAAPPGSECTHWRPGTAGRAMR